MTSSLEPTIGLEVHVQLATKAKLFCACSTSFGAAPNHQICPVCTGQPGALPVLNGKAVEFAIKMALATRSAIRQRSRFARKNYFYPDLPKGYQISQYDEPLAEHGQVEIWGPEGTTTIGITRIHLEEDAGKSIHAPGKPYSLVDLNRAGVPLIEIVSEPEIRTPMQAAEYMRTIRAIVRALGISDGNLEQGSLRCDANVSVRPTGQEKLGTKVEIKNINSFRFVQKALEYEIERQIGACERGEPILQETRLFDSTSGKTMSMRSKEEAHDYRYFPDPDLPPLVVAEELVARLASESPELPIERRSRFIEQFQLSLNDAIELTRELEIADLFEQTVNAGAKPKRAAAWILTNVLAQVSDARELGDIRVGPQEIAGLLQLVDQGTLSMTLAKEVWREMCATGRPADAIAKERNLVQQSDTSALDTIVAKIVAENGAKVAEYRQGKAKLFGWFVGQAMRATQGRANPVLLNELIERHLKGDE